MIKEPIKEGLRGFFLKNKNQADLPIVTQDNILILSTKIQKASDKPKVSTNRAKRDLKTKELKYFLKTAFQLWLQHEFAASDP